MTDCHTHWCIQEMKWCHHCCFNQKSWDVFQAEAWMEWDLCACSKGVPLPSLQPLKAPSKHLELSQRPASQKPAAAIQPTAFFGGGRMARLDGEKISSFTRGCGATGFMQVNFCFLWCSFYCVVVGSVSCYEPVERLRFFTPNIELFSFKIADPRHCSQPQSFLLTSRPQKFQTDNLKRKLS